MSIPIRRITDRLDGFLNKKDYHAAEQLLLSWLNEAQEEKDLPGRLALLNEQIGLYRKIGRGEDCLKAISAALQLAGESSLANSLAAATTFLNGATGYKAFGFAEKALPLYEQAKLLYEEKLDPEDRRLAALYNNMALALADLNKFEEAGSLFERAIEILKLNENSEGEIAITLLNLADLAAARDGLEAAEKYIDSCLEQAEQLLDEEHLPKDGYYAFICEKCAPVFDYYGRFLTRQKLEQRAREIYERT